jgi:hypothetical protein
MRTANTSLRSTSNLALPSLSVSCFSTSVLSLRSRNTGSPDMRCSGISSFWTTWMVYSPSLAPESCQTK